MTWEWRAQPWGMEAYVCLREQACQMVCQCCAEVLLGLIGVLFVYTDI